MNLKRIGTLLLAAAMSASFMAGCGDQPAQSSGSQPESSKPESSAAQSETSGFSYPTTGSLTFWQWANGNVGANFASFEDTPAAGYAEEATGVKVDYIDDHSNTDEAFQLMTTSDKLPDLIGYGWATTAASWPPMRTASASASTRSSTNTCPTSRRCWTPTPT